MGENPGLGANTCIVPHSIRTIFLEIEECLAFGAIRN